MKSTKGFSKTEVLNAFRLLSKEAKGDEIDVMQIEDMLKYSLKYDEVEVIALTEQLKAAATKIEQKNGEDKYMLNFEDFIEREFS